MAETNLNTSSDFDALDVDFVNQFTKNITGLLNLLNVTRKISLTQNDTIQTYKDSVVKASGTAGEGEQIPLTKVTHKKDKEYKLTLNKRRRRTSAEAIMHAGTIQAVDNADQTLLTGDVYPSIKKIVFDQLGAATNTKAKDGASLQGAVAQALASVKAKTENYTSGQNVVFVNTFDIADYLAAAQISTQTAYGFDYLKNFLGAQLVIISADVPQGKVFATPMDNLVYAYAPISGDMGTALGLTTDASGLVGVAHERVQDSLAVDTVMAWANVVFAENADWIAQASIVAPAVSGTPGK